jgi:ABC transporter DrrB family efflux protein
VDALENTQAFEVVERPADSESFSRAITSGRAKAGILIPADYSERLLLREKAEVQFWIDGSDSQVATTALNTVNLLAMQTAFGRARSIGESMQVAAARNERGEASSPIEVRARLLFNPNLESSHFFVPGLIAIILQLVLLFLTSFSIVREREMGTLEQLFVTPVGRMGLLMGKLVPYALMAFGELLIILVTMQVVFGVPIHGSLLLLLVLSALYIVTVLGLGLLISTIATTQLEAIQLAFLIMLPSVFLSGFMFPRSEMIAPIRIIGNILPVTYFVEIVRGVILRGADLIDLVPDIVGLAICCVVILSLSLRRFRKQLD